MCVMQIKDINDIILSSNNNIILLYINGKRKSNVHDTTIRVGFYYRFILAIISCNFSGTRLLCNRCEFVPSPNR